MTARDAQRWDARYAHAGDVEPQQPDLLRGREELLPPDGRALDVACGRGAVARWLAARGFVVDAVDVSPVAITAGRAEAPEITWWCHDLDDGLPCTGLYDVVVCQRFRDPRLYPALATALAPGGLLLVTVLSEMGDAPGPYRAAPGELLTAFPGLRVLEHAEHDGEATLIARSPVD